MNPIDRSPTLLSSALAFGACAVVVATFEPAPTVALLLSVTGIGLLGLGLIGGRQILVSSGAVVIVGGVVVEGVGGAPVLPTAAGVTAGILAWDFGTTAVSLGEQLGREAPTARLELVHAAASTAVGLALVTVAYLIFESATGGQPVTAVFGLLIAAFVLLAALRRISPRPE